MRSAATKVTPRLAALSLLLVKEKVSSEATAKEDG